MSGKGKVVFYRGKGDRRTVVPYTRRAKLAVARNLLRYAMRRYRENKIDKALKIAKKAREKIVRNNRNLNRNRNYAVIRGTASGHTKTTTKMLVKKTPRKQRFLRKLFKTNPIKTLYVNRFGFAWMGASAASRTIWYSVTNLKFNNVQEYMSRRITHANQNIGSVNVNDGSTSVAENSPDMYIYLGKCTYQYEIYNPTNYIVTVYIYDLICKRDTPYSILYSDAYEENSCAPENMMRKSTEVQYPNHSSTNPQWVIADATTAVTGTGGTVYYNTIGMKPTDYHYFNTFWKVKGIKKIVLPPTTTHHHIVVYNPKKKITQASLYMPRQKMDQNNQKMGIGGLTQATLFGFQGQVACEDNQSDDNTTSVGTLPGKLIISCIRKENVWSGQLTVQNIVQTLNMKSSWTKPTIFTDLVEAQAAST